MKSSLIRQMSSLVLQILYLHSPRSVTSPLTSRVLFSRAVDPHFSSTKMYDEEALRHTSWYYLAKNCLTWAADAVALGARAVWLTTCQGNLKFGHLLFPPNFLCTFFLTLRFTVACPFLQSSVDITGIILKRMSAVSHIRFFLHSYYLKLDDVEETDCKNFG